MNSMLRSSTGTKTACGPAPLRAAPGDLDSPAGASGCSFRRPRYGFGGLVEGVTNSPRPGGVGWPPGRSSGRQSEGWLRGLPATYVTDPSSSPACRTSGSSTGSTRSPRISPYGPSFRAVPRTLEPELRLKGGLRVRGGDSNEYHVFAPPRVELGGDRTGGVTLVSREVGRSAPWIDADEDGVYELPLYAGNPGRGAGPGRRGTGRPSPEASFTLVEVAHAGAGRPASARYLDGFGRPAAGPPGWCGAWVEATGLPRFDFRSLAPPAADPMSAADDRAWRGGHGRDRGRHGLPLLSRPLRPYHLRRARPPLPHPTPTPADDELPVPRVAEQPEVTTAMKLHSTSTSRSANGNRLTPIISSPASGLGLDHQFASAPARGRRVDHPRSGLSRRMVGRQGRRPTGV